MPLHSAVKARITEPVKLDLSLATCTASSFYSKAYSCMHAFDGKFGRYAEWSSAKGKAKGEWFEVVLSRHHAVPIIQVDFYTSYWASKLLHSLQYQLFCNNSHPPDEEISKAELVFDGTEKRIMAVSKDRHAKNVLKIDPPIFAKKVKVVALEMHKYVSLIETCLDFFTFHPWIHRSTAKLVSVQELVLWTNQPDLVKPKVTCSSGYELGPESKCYKAIKTALSLESAKEWCKSKE